MIDPRSNDGMKSPGQMFDIPDIPDFPDLMATKSPLKTRPSAAPRHQRAPAFHPLSGVLITSPHAVNGRRQEEEQRWLPAKAAVQGIMQILAAVPAHSGQLVIDVADARRSLGYRAGHGGTLGRPGSKPLKIAYHSGTTLIRKPIISSRTAAPGLSRRKPNSQENPELTQRQRFIQALKQAEGGAYTGRELSELLQASRQSLAERRTARTIVYWTDSRRRAHYPKWQFDDEFKVIPAIRTILKLLRTDDMLHILATFLVPAAALGDLTVLGLIRAQRIQEAIAHVESSPPR